MSLLGVYTDTTKFKTLLRTCAKISSDILFRFNESSITCYQRNEDGTCRILVTIRTSEILYYRFEMDEILAIPITISSLLEKVPNQCSQLMFQYSNGKLTIGYADQKLCVDYDYVSYISEVCPTTWNIIIPDVEIESFDIPKQDDYFQLFQISKAMISMKAERDTSHYIIPYEKLIDIEYVSRAKVGDSGSSKLGTGTNKRMIYIDSVFEPLDLDYNAMCMILEALKIVKGPSIVKFYSSKVEFHSIKIEFMIPVDGICTIYASRREDGRR